MEKSTPTVDSSPITNPSHIPQNPTYAPTMINGQVVVAAAQRISGPIPAASEMMGYKDVGEDLPDRIMKMAELNAVTERKLRERNQIFQFADSALRRLIALLALLAMLGMSGWVIQSGHGAAGAFLGGSTIVAVIYAFVRKDGSENEPNTKKPDASKQSDDNPSGEG
ncbi:hypothetical protein [Komagataeibacter xylinus]|uniref:hypothetical protein n=1 Tax=Komagataeibacter xylinus TaxID=28448 RepID=UPI00280B892E|nr:hypothetical protein [Komagataeibacter xylinus]